MADIKFGSHDVDNFMFGINQIDKIYRGSNEVWASYSGPPSPVTITASGTYTAGVDFPANIELSICMIGGGASGWADKGSSQADTQKGGLSGEVIETTVVVPRGDLTVTIGTGGAGTSSTNTVGNAGTSTIFSTLTAAGGTTSGHLGNGGSRSGCWGSSNDGSNDGYSPPYSAGGQAGFGNGGVRHTGDTGNGGNGGVGAGGGGCRIDGGSGNSGAGGRGEIRISW